jgi:hypothetical protein
VTTPELYDRTLARARADRALETGLDLGRDLGRRELAERLRAAQFAGSADAVGTLARLLAVLDEVTP